MGEYEEITLSMQKAPSDGYIRFLAFDYNPDNGDAKLSHMQEFNQEEYDEVINMLESYMKQLKKSRDSNCTLSEEVEE